MSLMCESLGAEVVAVDGIISDELEVRKKPLCTEIRVL